MPTTKIIEKESLFKLYDFNFYDDIPSNINKYEINKYVDNKKFIVQMFGLSKSGKSASIIVNGFNPFFYVKVSDDFNEEAKKDFIDDMKTFMGKYYINSIIDSELIQKHKLYLFDNHKLHNFIKITFSNTMAFNKAKKMFYTDIYKKVNNKNIFIERKLIEQGYIFENEEIKSNCYLYEGDIPPLLKLFHINKISPSGWISIPNKKTKTNNTHCYYEYEININEIKRIDIDEIVKYKICSFDIEASSSHGDFPLAIKDYKKLATNILENYVNLKHEEKNNYNETILKREILSAFDYDNLPYIQKIYSKNKKITKEKIEEIFDDFIKYIPAKNKNKNKNNDANLNNMDNESSSDDDEENQNNELEETKFKFKKNNKPKIYNKKDINILDLIKDEECDYLTKINEVNIGLNLFYNNYAPIEGDIITFIGLSFINYSDKSPHRRVIIVKGGCQIPEKYISWYKENNVTLITKETEKEVVLTFTKIITNDNPDIITGYNITGFDFEFMYQRSQELDCVHDFLKLSKNRNEVCISKDWRTGIEDIETNKIVLASGEYNLRFPKMPGRIIMDLYVIFRKEFQLSSNKLDYVSSYFISDDIKNIEYDKENKTTKIFTKNLMGIGIGTFVKFEEIGFSNNPYKKGQKFEIIDINLQEKWFIIDSLEYIDLNSSKYNWGLAKDDVSPQEIFSLANGSDFDRWTVGKYCLGDCDNVIWLLLKVDIITDKVEMSNLCDVPLTFLLLRGQGIKLHSFVSKKCGEKNTLMPTNQKKQSGEGYEGAIVFEPETGIYLEEAVACVDYSSLYPSSIISENLSHDSKVWTKEYDLDNNLIKELGDKDENENFIYDNLEGYKYVDIKYDTYKYLRASEKAAAKKVIVGYKICRFAQFPTGKAIMPSILEELLGARKSTRELIPLEKDEFKKNILDKRQLSIKVTANSLYGQTGAETSAFNEGDVAASTTAIGRKLVLYAKNIIESCYDNIKITMSDGREVTTKAECVYGDSVTNKTPIYIRKNKENIEILNVEDIAKKYGNLTQWEKCQEDGKQEKLYMNLNDEVLIETWSSNGWTKLERLIKHELHESKKIIRILTHTGLVDVTDDHSLLKIDGTIISPKNINIGNELLHKTLNLQDFEVNNITTDINIKNNLINKSRISGFFFGDGSCGCYDCTRGKKSAWALNNSNYDLLNYYKDLCIKVYPDFEWKILDTLNSSGVYKLVPKGNNLKQFIITFRNNHYNNYSKIIPNDLLNSSKEIRQAFWDGLYDADGDKDKNGYIRIDQKSQLSASYICLLANSIGFKTSLNNRKDKPEIYRVTCTKNSQRKNCNAIKKLDYINDYVKNNSLYYENQDINNKIYVYDLTTNNHHFAAGIGNIIVHNTDSVFFKFNLLDTTTKKKIINKQALIYTIELAKQAGNLATKFLKNPHDLEYEKTFWPFILLSKKRYVGILYEEDPNKGKLKYMGIVLKRRDNAPIVKDIYGGIVNIILKEKNIANAIEFLNISINNLIKGKINIEKLLITKSLRGYYKNPNQIAHKVLAERMGIREPGTKPTSGDRLSYAFIKNENKKALQGEKIETVSYIQKHDLKLDYGHYITNQIMKPLLQLFALDLLRIPEFTDRQNLIKESNNKKILSYEMEIEKLKGKWNEPEKLKKKLEELKCKEVKACLFDKYINSLK
jgi:DNA polymerase elongation subunit (family B)